MSYDHDKLASLDVETECAVADCADTDCKHALIPHLARITVVGVYFPTLGGMGFRAFRNLDELRAWLDSRADLVFVGANFKFDLKTLAYNGVHIPPERWVEDVVLQATASYEKIPAAWLAQYEERRRQKNKDSRLKGAKHRAGKKHSLKTLAPYFLGVEAFWETPWNHDDDTYLEKDCRYTYDLCDLFRGKLQAQGTDKYYYEHLLGWAKMFLAAEMRGVKIDMELLAEEEKKAAVRATAARAKLDAAWAAPYEAAHRIAVEDTNRKYRDMAAAQLAKRVAPSPSQTAAVEARYKQLESAALSKLPAHTLDPDSPTDVLWILRDYYGLDVQKFDGDQSTGKEVLERLAGQGRDDCRLLLEYRENHKLLTAFFAAYKVLNRGGILHANFNLDVAKTGRTSSSGPNLQNVAGELHQLFVARPGFLLDTNDLSAIEPTLIAYLSEDQTLCELLISDADFHGHCANVIFGTNWNLKTLRHEHKRERAFAKEVDLSVFYGAGFRRVQHSSYKHGFCFTQQQSRRAVDRLRAAWPGVTRFKEMIDDLARSEPIENIFGFKRSFVGAPEDIYMQAFNSLIQGSASMLLLDASMKAHQAQIRAGLEVYPLMWVHDEAVDEVREEHGAAAHKIKVDAMTSYKLMTKWGRIPLKVEGKLSKRWEK